MELVQNIYIIHIFQGNFYLTCYLLQTFEFETKPFLKVLKVQLKPSVRTQGKHSDAVLK